MTTLIVNSDDLRKNHALLVGVQPTALQRQLYDAFPQNRGFMSGELNPELFEAVIVTALVQTFTKKTQPDPFRVLLIVSSQHQKWATSQLQNFTKVVFERLKAQRAKAVAQALGKAFKAIYMGSNVLQLDTPPTHWAGFGFNEKDTIPDWLRLGLLVISNT